MNDHTTARRHYLELTALFIEHEIAKFRRGEQAGLMSFHNVAKLAGNASEVLMAAGACQRVRTTLRSCPRADVHRRSA
jgi:hypothetical protein